MAWAECRQLFWSLVLFRERYKPLLTSFPRWQPSLSAIPPLGWLLVFGSQMILWFYRMLVGIRSSSGHLGANLRSIHAAVFLETRLFHCKSFLLSQYQRYSFVGAATFSCSQWIWQKYIPTCMMQGNAAFYLVVVNLKPFILFCRFLEPWSLSFGQCRRSTEVHPNPVR